MAFTCSYQARGVPFYRSTFLVLWIHSKHPILVMISVDWPIYIKDNIMWTWSTLSSTIISSTSSNSTTVCNTRHIVVATQVIQEFTHGSQKVVCYSCVGNYAHFFIRNFRLHCFTRHDQFSWRDTESWRLQSWALHISHICCNFFVVLSWNFQRSRSAQICSGTTPSSYLLPPPFWFPSLPLPSLENGHLKLSYFSCRPCTSDGYSTVNETMLWCDFCASASYDTPFNSARVMHSSLKLENVPTASGASFSRIIYERGIHTDHCREVVLKFRLKVSLFILRNERSWCGLFGLYVTLFLQKSTYLSSLTGGCQLDRKWW